jgi:hypothetical protein
MHTPQGASLVIKSNVGLSNDWLQTMSLELILTESSGEETAGIFPSLDVEYECTFQVCLSEDHRN